MSRSTDWNLMYERYATGKWRRLQEKDSTSFPDVAPHSDTDERDLESLKQAQADEAAFLVAVHSDKFEQTWDVAAAQLRNTISRATWTASISSLRASLGALASRQRIAVLQTTTLQGGPPGRYFVLQYQSKFEKRPVAAESVAEMLGEDGHWHVAGYSVN